MTPPKSGSHPPKEIGGASPGGVGPWWAVHVGGAVLVGTKFSRCFFPLPTHFLFFFVVFRGIVVGSTRFQH